MIIIIHTPVGMLLITLFMNNYKVDEKQLENDLHRSVSVIVELNITIFFYLMEYSLEFLT